MEGEMGGGTSWGVRIRGRHGPGIRVTKVDAEEVRCQPSMQDSMSPGPIFKSLLAPGKKREQVWCQLHESAVKLS
jgi:hypothetical protein